MAPLRLNVNINAAKHVGGVYPFAVVCFDGDISHELYKSNAATTQHDGLAVWNDTFTVDLTNEFKSLEADHRPQPKYLTFFLFDTGSPGIPSLGSAGVLLSNVRDRGRSAGDFPVVNGSGSLALVVELEKADNEGFFHSDAAKITAGVASAGAALGLGALAFNKYKNKKKKLSEQEEEQLLQDQYAEENRGHDTQQSDRPWYDPETSSDEEQNAVHAGQAGDTYAQQSHVAAGAYHEPGVAYASGQVHGVEGEDDSDDDDDEE
ncbi:unnamed protein product [Agarophyton chilense]|eukprot:gb/GEZJ01000081.1/.p2 GENE.gb/GEZJ01000081.1/~~gb/GEZJ01000081.1/.p2  ORF type:complete len:263 (-),score=58.74 gb/GEZJ01000081.1/:4217-5005(-)